VIKTTKESSMVQRDCGILGSYKGRLLFGRFLLRSSNEWLFHITVVRT
jgi:hypothetical protein